MRELINIGKIEIRIFQIRGRRVMLDADLAMLYMVETKQLKRQVNRNIKRFPADFMFKLTAKETENLRCQFGTSSCGGRRHLPYVFTEQGIAMLSSVLNSERAIMANIQIMRAFVNLKKEQLTYILLKRKIEQIEKKYDGQFNIIFEAIKKLLVPLPIKQKPQIGFKPDPNWAHR